VTGTARLELGIVVFAILILVLVAASLMNVVRQPPRAWAQSGVRKELWIALLVLSPVLPVPGIVIPLVYLFGVRRKLARAA
jgi:hypothetical protein